MMLNVERTVIFLLKFIGHQYLVVMPNGKKRQLPTLHKDSSLKSLNVSFLGSVDTLINPAKLRALVYEDPIKQNGKLDIYEDPISDHQYVMTVDVSRGTNQDYSAFTVIDTTTIPYRLVAKFKDNDIKPIILPNIIHQVAKAYNKCHILIEVNDIGAQVADILQYDLEYDNLLMCSMRGRAGTNCWNWILRKESITGS